AAFGEQREVGLLRTMDRERGLERKLGEARQVDDAPEGVHPQADGRAADGDGAVPRPPRGDRGEAVERGALRGRPLVEYDRGPGRTPADAVVRHGAPAAADVFADGVVHVMAGYRQRAGCVPGLREARIEVDVCAAA